MNEKQSHEFEELSTLEASGTLEDTQKERLAELKSFKDLAEKASNVDTKTKETETALAQKEHFRTKFEKAEAERLAAEAKLNDGSNDKSKLDVSDYIDISTSLEGLDQKEKERLAREHKLTGKPISEIRKDEDFLLWQSAHRAKVEKEKLTIPPSGKQPDADGPISLAEALAGAQTVEEKEKILQDSLGYSIGNKSRSDKVIIGR